MTEATEQQQQQYGIARRSYLSITKILVLHSVSEYSLLDGSIL